MAVSTAVTVTGSVLNARTGSAVSGVAVSSGADETTTDANGDYSLSVSVAEESARVAVSFSSSSYVATQRIVEASSGDSADVDTTLLPVSLSISINPAVAQTLVVSGSPAQVSLTASSLVDSSGVTVTDPVTANVTPVDPSSDPELMPGDFVATTSDGETIKIESFGALDVSFTDSDGNALNLADGQTATVRIPVSFGASAPPASIPLFYYDADQGLWVEEGTATLNGESPTQYYEGTVSHFSMWNADQRRESTNICGRIVDRDGAEIDPGDYASIKVYSFGVDYTSFDESAEDWTPGECEERFSLFFGCLYDDATFAVSAKANATVDIYVEARLDDTAAYQTNKVMVSTGADAVFDECITDLTDALVLDTSNAVPVVKSVSSDKTYVGPGAEVILTCSAADADGDTLSYAWEVNSDFSTDMGTLSANTGASVTWTASQTVSSYFISCTVSDGSTEDEQSVFVSQMGNNTPVVSSLTAASESVTAGATTTLSCNATDADGDELTYTWNAMGGTLSDSTATPVWTAPSADGYYTIICTAGDGGMIGGGMGAVTIQVTGGSGDDSDTGGTSADVPSGFPTDLPEGDYQLSYSYTVTVSGIESSGSATLPTAITYDGDIDVFADAVVAAIEASAQTYIDLGCTATTSYADWDGTSFSATLTVDNCSAQGVTYSVEYTFTLTKI